MPRMFDDTGVCLAEVMVAMAAGAVLLSATFQALHLFDRQLTSQQSTMSRHQDQRLGLHVLTDELRLAGSGAPNESSAIQLANSQEIEFLANLDGSRTFLTESVSALQTELPVLNGSSWDQGKYISICTVDRCGTSRLAVDGRRSKLTVTTPMDQPFPVGSEVSISNRIRYYVSGFSDGKQSLMRQVDGGANTIIGDLAHFRLRYFDKEGMPTSHGESVSRIRIELGVGSDRSYLISEIGIRGR